MGYGIAPLVANKWYRVIVTAKCDSLYRVYVDGALYYEGLYVQAKTALGFGKDSRASLLPDLYIFRDNDGDDAGITCSELGIWDVVLSAEQVALIGSIPVITGVEKVMVNNSELSQNYPNPVKNSTTFPYQINETGNVTFNVIDISGRIVDVINVGNKTQGSYKLNMSTEKLNTGIYFVSMNVNQHSSIKKMVVIK